MPYEHLSVSEEQFQSGLSYQPTTCHPVSYTHLDVYKRQSLAYMGKKVVIVGLDIRKPGLNKVFNLSHRTEGIAVKIAISF